MGNQKKDSNTEAIYAGIGLVGMGVLFHTLGSPFIAIGLCGIGGVSAAYYIYDTIHFTKEKEIFRKCGLMADNKCPEILHKNHSRLEIKIPVGLSFNSFKAKKDVLESAFNCSLEFEQIAHNKLYIHFKPTIPFSS